MFIVLGLYAAKSEFAAYDRLRGLYQCEPTQVYQTQHNFISSIYYAYQYEIRYTRWYAPVATMVTSCLVFLCSFRWSKIYKDIVYIYMHIRDIQVLEDFKVFCEDYDNIIC